MNIFQVLSQGKSRLHEVSMSAMLGYLLDSRKDHGLGDAFVREFLRHIDPNHFEKILKNDFINAQTEFEKPYPSLNGKGNYMDIELCLVKDKDHITHKIIIENKIRVGAANPQQLNEYYHAVVNDDKEEKKPDHLFVVFLTPNLSNIQFRNEYNNLDVDHASGHHKHWVHWDSGENSIVAMVRSVLENESLGKINPINEYMRQTLKAFICHSSTLGQSLERSIRSDNLGSEIDNRKIETKDGEKYLVVMRDSSQIQVFNLNTNEQEVAKQILAKYINENNLAINYKALNTRQVGKRLFELVS